MLHARTMVHPRRVYIASQEGQVSAMLDAQRAQRDSMLHSAAQQQALQREMEVG